MRKTILVAVSTAAITAVITAWATAAVIGPRSKVHAAPTAALMDVPQITLQAKDLPAQQFDAH